MAFPTEEPQKKRASFAAAANHHHQVIVNTPMEDATLLKTLVSAADEHTIQQAIPDEPFLSAETKTIIAALLAEFLGTVFLVLVSVGIQVRTLTCSWFCWLLVALPPHGGTCPICEASNTTLSPIPFLHFFFRLLPFRPFNLCGNICMSASFVLCHVHCIICPCGPVRSVRTA